MKRVLPSSFACVLALGLLGCSAAPRAVAGSDDAGSRALSDRDVAILAASDQIGDDADAAGIVSRGGGTSGGEGGFTLGAGDSLGQHVFSHAVAQARAENPANGWRYADASTSASISTSGGGSDRAIYPPFLGVDRPLDTRDTFETVWIFTSLLPSHPRNPRNPDTRNGDAPLRGVDKPAPVIVLVPVE